MKRRKFIGILGSSAVVTAATGLTGFALTRTPEKAIQPWQEAGELHHDIRKYALSYAILAPNPHNRQPWQVRLDQGQEMTLYCDPERKLPFTDPYDRQIAIGLGCFLEILEMAAKEQSYGAKMQLFPEGVPKKRLDTRPIARVRFYKDSQLEKDPMFPLVLQRRSNKEPYSNKQISLDEIMGLIYQTTTGVRVVATAEKEMVNNIKDLTWAGHQNEVYTPRTYKESVDLMRIGKKEIEASPDGIDLGGTFFDTLKLLGMISREQIADPESTSFKQGLEHYRELLHATPGYSWIVTKGNSRYDQIEAGRVYLRSNLQATQLGLAMHPISQCLQEYPEVQEQYQKLHALLQVVEPERIQMLSRIGYGPEVSPSPRWRMESAIR